MAPWDRKRELRAVDETPARYTQTEFYFIDTVNKDAYARVQGPIDVSLLRDCELKSASIDYEPF